MASDKPETVFNIENLFVSINDSFTKSAKSLRQSFEDDPDWQDSPYIYHMPKMSLSMRLSLSFSKGKVKGLFSKKSTDRQEQLSSVIEVEVVAVPNDLPPKAEPDDSGQPG